MLRIICLCLFPLVRNKSSICFCISLWLGGGVLLLLNACSHDILVPCESNAFKSGLLCKQYIYQGGVVIGYYSYYYNSTNQLTKKVLLRGNGTTIREMTYEYNSSNQLIQEGKHEESNGADTLYKYTYNSLDSLAIKYTYAEDQLITYSTYSYHSHNQLATIINYVADTVFSFTDYTYLTDGRPYKIIDYAADTAINAFTQYTYYANNLIKIESYEGLNLSSYELLEYENDILIKVSTFSPDHSLSAYFLYEYNDLDNIRTIRLYNESDELISSNEFEYYY